MLIDIHVHARPAPPLVQRPGRTRTLGTDALSMMDAAGIDMAAVMSGVSPETRPFIDTTEEVLALCREHADRFIPFCGIDPRMVGNSPKADFGPMLQTYKEAGFKGVGEYTANLPFDDPLNLNVFRHVEKAGLPLLFHIGHRLGECYGVYDEIGLPRLAKVLRQFSGLTFIGHSEPFWSEISADVDAEKRKCYPKGKVTPGRVVELMHNYPNLRGDLSAGSGYNAITRDPEFGYGFLEEFQDQLLFGTDIAYVGQELPIVPYFRKLAAENLISREAHEKITWRNTRDLLGLECT